MISDDFRFRLLLKLGALLYPSYSFLWPQVDWLADRSFQDYLKKFGEQRGLNKERRWMVKELMRLTEAVPGDTAECGVFEGASSYLICQMNAACQNFDRQHHIFDSFEGLSEPSGADGTHWHRGDLARHEDVVRRNLAEYTALRLYKGWIPERFDDVADRSFSFVHIDVDLYQPTLDSLRFFFPRLSPGGILLCDDFGFQTCPGATKAVTEYLSEQPESMIALPAGGGFLIKGVATSRHGALQST